MNKGDYPLLDTSMERPENGRARQAGFLSWAFLAFVFLVVSLVWSELAAPFRGVWGLGFIEPSKFTSPPTVVNVLITDPAVSEESVFMTKAMLQFSPYTMPLPRLENARSMMGFTGGNIFRHFFCAHDPKNDLRRRCFSKVPEPQFLNVREFSARSINNMVSLEDEKNIFKSNIGSQFMSGGFFLGSKQTDGRCTNDDREDGDNGICKAELKKPFHKALLFLFSAICSGFGTVLGCLAKRNSGAVVGCCLIALGVLSILFGWGIV